MPTGVSNPPRTLRLAAYCWAFFGAVMAIFGFIKGQEWPTALATGLLSGGAFAVLVVLLASYQRQGQPVEETEVHLSEPERRVAARAATRGAVPVEPEVRRAALRVAVHRLERLSRHAILMVSLLSGVFVVEVVLALTVGPLHWLGAALAALAVVARLAAQTRLRRRVALLNLAVPEPAPSRQALQGD